MIDKITYRITFKQSEFTECYVKAKHKKEALKKFENNEGYDYDQLDGGWSEPTDIEIEAFER